jgi:hypothetical protein
MTVLGNFIVNLMGLAPTQVIRGYPNRTPQPPTSPPAGYPVGYVVMTEITKKRLRTNVDNFDATQQAAPAPGPVTSEIGQQLDIQIDVYGANSFEWSDILTTLLRDNIGCVALAPVCQPLHADDPIRGPLTNAEMQYEDRWIVQLKVQYNPVITTAQNYATVLGPVNIEVPIS